MVLKCYETISDRFPNRIFFSPFPQSSVSSWVHSLHCCGGGGGSGDCLLFFPPSDVVWISYTQGLFCRVFPFPFFPPRMSYIPLTVEIPLSFPGVQASGWYRKPTQRGEGQIKTHHTFSTPLAGASEAFALQTPLSIPSTRKCL